MSLPIHVKASVEYLRTCQRYAAGIGAGRSIGSWCSRFDGSYPSLVAMQLGVKPEDLDFTFTACSGAVVDGIIDQAQALSSDQKSIMVSAVCASLLI